MLVKKIFLISLILISRNSFALNSQEAKELSEKSRIEYVYARINGRASNGYCELDVYKEFVSKSVKDQLVKDGYKLNDSDRVYMDITWCD